MGPDRLLMNWSFLSFLLSFFTPTVKKMKEKNNSMHV